MPATADDRPLLVTADPDLLDDLLRLAAAAGVEVEVAPDVASARGGLAARAARRRRCRRSPDRAGLGCRGARASSWSGATSTTPASGSARSRARRRARRASCPTPRPGWSTARRRRGGAGGAGGARRRWSAAAAARVPSTLAAALAVTARRRGAARAARRRSTRSAAASTSCSARGRAGLRWPDLAAAPAAGCRRGAAASLPRVRRAVTVLSWDRGDPCRAAARSAMRAVLAAAAGAHDLVVARPAPRASTRRPRWHSPAATPCCSSCRPRCARWPPRRPGRRAAAPRWPRDLRSSCAARRRSGSTRPDRRRLLGPAAGRVAARPSPGWPARSSAASRRAGRPGPLARCAAGSARRRSLDGRCRREAA